MSGRRSSRKTRKNPPVSEQPQQPPQAEEEAQEVEEEGPSLAELLPGNCSGGAIVVMLEVQALALGNLGGVVASKPLLHVIQHGPLSPCTRDDVVLVVLFVHHGILLSGCLVSQEVVDAQAGEDDGLHCGRHLCHSTQKTPESVGKNAKGILHTSPGSGKSIVKYPLLHGQWLGTKRLHQGGA